jgi:hypothetical protein
MSLIDTWQQKKPPKSNMTLEIWPVVDYRCREIFLAAQLAARLLICASVPVLICDLYTLYGSPPRTPRILTVQLWRAPIVNVRSKFCQGYVRLLQNVLMPCAFHCSLIWAKRSEVHNIIIKMKSAVAIVMVFVGCCSNVVFLELLVK